MKALKNFNITINPGEFVVVVGLSGAGKSTMLRCVNRLVTPTDGKVYIDGKDITGANGTALKRLRREVGMIFQNFNLVKRSPVLRNVLAGRVSYVPTWRTLLGLFPKADREIALDCLQRVGIPEKAAVRADALSGGQQQRVGIARALAQKPKIILADEPVASLDPPTSHAVMRDLKRINREDNITTLVNLHFIDMALEYADRIIGLRDGELVFDGSTSEATSDVFEEIYGRPITDDDVIGEDSDAASF
ncbi:phosphonate transport system ATP-binding protein [Alkalispirochaeta americana]|uniref:Phosphonate transport system ATP-binding protein n=1 Tax=Alkalispirochaeta americana TaxID=159291 RepID=A0A1N6VXE6_9SPIO|nr:phosphonate transport system ATP-binding protein [Alkalispirochaeta americana]